MLVAVALLVIAATKLEVTAESLFIFCKNILGCKIFNVLKIKYLDIVSEGAAVTLNLNSSLFTDCILYPLENDTKWQ